uniref:Uncharacterized protein n=1 Tax=Schistocephalus solidus TaxID=70667 RepID=A0A0X3Q1J1_SCHSO
MEVAYSGLSKLRLNVVWSCSPFQSGLGANDFGRPMLSMLREGTVGVILGHLVSYTSSSPLSIHSPLSVHFIRSKAIQRLRKPIMFLTFFWLQLRGLEGGGAKMAHKHNLKSAICIVNSSEPS